MIELLSSLGNLSGAVGQLLVAGFVWVLLLVVMMVDIPIFWKSDKGRKALVCKTCYGVCKLLVAVVLVIASFAILAEMIG
ncbi:MAG: hypothetical protein FWD76_05525 [Firmicutes bacterium]|nr:hypothetical protein [Bacillota bacterium]